MKTATTENPRAGIRFVVVLINLLLVIFTLSGCGPDPRELGEKGDVAGLVALAEDADASSEDRDAAIQELGALATPEAVSALITWVESGGPEGKEWSAVSALGATGDPRAVAPLIAVFEAVNRSETEHVYLSELGDRLMREDIMRTFTTIQDPAVAEVLLGEVDAKNEYLYDDGELLAALVKQGMTIEPELVVRLSSEEHEIYHMAGNALVSIYQEAGVPEKLGVLLMDAGTYRIYVAILTRNLDGDFSQQLAVALDAYGDKEMAVLMVNSDNDACVEAAHAWAVKYGYMIWNY